MSFVSIFSGLSDPRSSLGRRYALDSLLGLILVGFLCGCNNMKSVWRLSHRLTASQRRALGFDKGALPSHPLLTTLLQRLDASALEAHMQEIMLSREGDKVQALSIDGKTLRGSRRGDRSAMHVLSAFSASIGGALLQEPMLPGENEVGAAMRLLERLELRGTVITGDAMFAHPILCEQICQQGGHYLFALKDNHKSRREAIELALDSTKKNAALQRKSSTGGA